MVRTASDGDQPTMPSVTGKPDGDHISDGVRMSRFFFDLLFDGKILLDPGGMIFSGTNGAKSAADKLAHHLMIGRAELRGIGSCVRVRNERGEEIHRSPIDSESSVDEHR